MALVAFMIFINLQFCPNNGREHCKRNDETEEEYKNRNVTSSEKEDCNSKIELQFTVYMYVVRTM